MKWFSLITLLIGLGINSLFSQSIPEPIVEPNTTFLPYLLDSTVTCSLSDKGEIKHICTRAYKYNSAGHLIFAERPVMRMTPLLNYEIIYVNDNYTLDSDGCISKIITKYGNDTVNIIECYEFDWGYKKEEIQYPQYKHVRTHGPWRNIWLDYKDGMLKELYGYEWKSNINDWMEESHDIYVYGINENLSEHFHISDQYWLDIIEQFEYTYDSNGNILSKISVCNYPYEQRRTREEWTYDGYGKKTNYIHFIWIADSTDWIEDERWTKTYDINGNETEFIHRHYGAMEDEREVWTYDVNGYNTVHMRYYGIRDCTVWTRDWKEENTYHPDGRIAERIRFCWDPDTGDSIQSQISQAYWSELGPGVTKYPEYFQSKIYPNPVDNLLTIETEQSDIKSISIISLNGQLIYQGEMEGITFQIDMSSFGKGVYLVKVRSEESVRTEKILKL